MTAIITELVERLALGPEGVDLRAELDALQSARVSQALEQTGGDLSRAAKLLRMSRLDLLRLEARLAAARAPGAAPPRFEPPLVDASAIPRIESGVEFVSAAAIRRLDAEGYTERQIAGHLGCNAYLVEKVLREATERKVHELVAAGAALLDIQRETRVPLPRLRRMISKAPPRRARTVSHDGAACAASKRRSQ